MKFSPLTIATLASLALSAPTSLHTRQTDESDLETITDNYLFTLTIDQFITNRNGLIGPPELDWSSDGCTDSPDHPLGFDFQDSCYRHDFGYRNYKNQNRFKAGKASIDSNFKQDMLNVCAEETDADRLKECKDTAEWYYLAVHLFGGLKRALEVREATIDIGKV